MKDNLRSSCYIRVLEEKNFGWYERIITLEEDVKISENNKI